MIDLRKSIKKNLTFFNKLSIVINALFLILLFFEFFLPPDYLIRNIQIWIGVYFTIELYLRLKMHKFKKKYILSFITILDALIIVLIFVRFFYIDSTILHFFTALKIFRLYRIIHELSKINSFFKLNKDIAISLINLLIFIFIMSSLVFVEQNSSNVDINTFLDSLYFTISTLTTTGFWDIIVTWNDWKILVILIMTFWTWLFLRLITTIFKPLKTPYQCKHCWLEKHERDASHCKHCGKIIYIKSEWDTNEIL